MLSFGYFPPRLPAQEEWISLTSGLTWLLFNHSMELHDLLDWAPQAFVSEDELRQALTNQWQQLIDHVWKREICLQAKLAGCTKHERIASGAWRPCRYVDWPQCPAFLQLRREHTDTSASSTSLTEFERQTLDDPVIARADVIAFKKVRHRVSDEAPDYESAERDLRAALSNVEKRTGLKWPWVQEIVEVYHLPEYQAVKLWTEVSQDFGFPQRGRPKKYRDENSKQ